MWLSRRIDRKVHLGQSVSHNRFFFVRNHVHKFCYNNDYSTTAKTYLRPFPFSTKL